MSILFWKRFGFRIRYSVMASFEKQKSLRNCTAMHDERKGSVKITLSPGNFPDTDQQASLSIILEIFLILFNCQPRSSYKVYSYKLYSYKLYSYKSE